MSTIPLRLFAVALATFTSVAHAGYLEELTSAARAAQLSTTREWLDLGHYRPDLLGVGYTSLVDTTSFFNAPNGKTNPETELDATLAAFFDPTPDPVTHQPRQCRYIARYHWLKDKLHFDSKRLPEQTCNRFNAWYAEISPNGVTLVFPSAHINNPSSMFGHTLLRIDSTKQSKDTRLFSYALNFAAATDEANGVVFAVKGLLGGYPGYFSTMPYYEKVKEYNDLENRDIWEYDLNLTPVETRRLLEHAWELGQVAFDYYFFDENCSYQLLAILDVARPGYNLVDRFHGWAIPSDTVRVVLEDQNFLAASHYRPSTLTRIQHLRELLTPAERNVVLTLANGASTARVKELPTGRQALVLDTAYDYLQYRYAEGDFPREKVAGPSMEILRERSRAPDPDKLPPVPVPRVRPDQGHGTTRVAFGFGSRAGKDYLEFRVRPAYHDLIDPVPGYAPGAQINFFDIRTRWQSAAERLELESFRVLEIASLSPRDEFVSPISWRVNAGFQRLPLVHMDSPDLMPTVSGGGGVAYRVGDGGIAFLLAEGLVAIHDDLPSDYTFGAGPETGFLMQRERFSLMLNAKAYRQSGLWEWMGEYGIEGSYAFNIDLSLRLSVHRTELNGDGATDAGLGIHGYF